MTAHNYTNTTDATIDVVLQAGMVRSRLVSIDAYLWAIVWVSPLYPDCTAWWMSSLALTRLNA
jgi:hypothetical protein